MISPFYKGISKEFPYFKQKNTVFWISSNFSQHVLAKYCSYGFHNPGACKVAVGGTLAQIWCQYLNYFLRGVGLTLFFFPEPRSWNKCVHFQLFKIFRNHYHVVLKIDENCSILLWNHLYALCIALIYIKRYIGH